MQHLARDLTLVLHRYSWQVLIRLRPLNPTSRVNWLDRCYVDNALQLNMKFIKFI